MAIIYIYDSTVTDFTYNGQPLNKAYEVVVDNIINDSFFVTFNHPLDDKGIYKIIEKDKIVKVHTPDGMQPFRIMDRVKYMDHISVEAWPLFYADMRNKLVKPLAIRGLTGQAAMNMFVNNLLIDTPFTFTSNITDAHDYHTQDTEERESNPNQLYNALDVFKDIVKRWQGELVINGYDVRVVSRLGKNTGALLYEKKNISDFTDEESIQDITTRLYGKAEWTERPEGSDEEVKHEISVKVESPLINAYSGIVFEKQYTNNDIRTEKEMKDWLNLKFTTDNIDKPSRNIKVGTNIVDDTVINLGDSLVLKYVKHDVDMEIRMVGCTYDGYANRYITIQLGDAKQSYVGNVQNTVRELETNVNTSVKQTVNQILNANGERMIYSVTEPVGNFKNGDIWFDQQGGMYFWDEEKGMWIDHPYNRNMHVMAEEVGKAVSSAEEAKLLAVSEAESALSKAKADATAKANAIKEQITGEVNTALSTAEDAKALAITEAENALALAKVDATEKANAVKTEVSNSVNTAIETAESAKQTAVDNYNNAVAEAERLVGEQTEAFDSKFSDIEDSVDVVSQSASDADTKAESALGKAGANANLLTTHQNTLNTINNTTIPNVNKVATDAMAEAKSALNSASSAMAEAQKADGKIADYVTKNGLVSGTTVDTKINEATGEISRKITTVESKIPTGAGINLIAKTAQGYTNGYIVGASEIGEPELVQERDGHSTSGYISIGNKGVSEAFTFSKETVEGSDDYFRIAWISEYGNVLRRDISTSNEVTLYSPPNAVQVRLSFPTGSKPKMEKGSVATPWTPAPEDNYTQEEFKIFESTYSEDVKGINSSLTALENSKLDGNTYTTFYKNEYEKTAEKATDTYNKVSKIVDENGNAKDTFAKAVYDQNATRRTAEFKLVTDDLVTTATYSEGVKGINQSISTIRGNLKNLKVGGENLLSTTAEGYADGYIVAIGEDGSPPVFWSADSNTISAYIDIGNKGVEEDFVFTKKTVGNDATNEYFRIVWISEFGNVLRRDAVSDNVFVTKSPSNAVKVRFSFPTGSQAMLQKGNKPTEYVPSLQDQLGKSEFSVFKNDYKETAESVERILTAIDSDEEGSFATRLNKTESTAKGNTTTISNIKTKPGEQITGYQTIKERSDLYERVIGSTNEADVRSNISRIVQTSNVIQQTVTSAMNVENRNLLITKNATGNTWLQGGESYPNPTSATGSGTSTSPDLIKVKDGDKFTLSKNETTLYFRVSFLNSSKGYIGRYVQNAILGTITPPNGTAYMWVSYPTDKDAKIEKGEIATGFTLAPEDTATQSQITQLADNINLKVSNSDLLSEINVQAGSVLIQSGTNKLNVTPDTTFIQDATIKSAMIDTVNVKKLTGVTADFTTMVTSALTANTITSTMINANDAMFTKLFATSMATDKLVAQGAWITNANVVSLDAGKIKTGTIDSGRINASQIVTNGLSADVVKSTHIESSIGLIDKIFANEALITRLTSNSIFASKIKAIEIDAGKITSGELAAARIRSKDVVTAGLSADVVQATHIKAEAGLVGKLFSTTAYIEELTNKTVFTEKIQAINISADKVTTGTLDASKVKVVNLDANNITANKTQFIQSTWNDISSEVTVDGSGIKTQNINGDFSRIVSGELRSFNANSSSTAILGSGRSQYFDENGSQFILGKTLHGNNWINDGTLQVTYNRRFAIGRYADYAGNNGIFHPYIALEYAPDKPGDEPNGIVRLYKAVYLQKGIYAGNNDISGLSKISFSNGGQIESQPKTSNLLIGSSNKIVAYAAGTNAFEIDSGYMYLRRNLSMEGNNITNQSDRRLKTNIVDTPVDSLSAILNWNFKAFDRVNNGNHDDIGLLAQDTSEIVVYDEENDIYNVNSSKQIMMNSHAIQQSYTVVTDEISQLKAQIASLQDELALLKGA